MKRISPLVGAPCCTIARSTSYGHVELDFAELGSFNRGDRPQEVLALEAAAVRLTPELRPGNRARFRSMRPTLTGTLIAVEP